MKCKFWAACSCIVMEINAKRSIALRLGDMLIGNVTIPPNHAIPKPGQVVVVKYLYVRGRRGFGIRMQIGWWL
jgi:bifunctional non-homologous end joining protein LigD